MPPGPSGREPDCREEGSAQGLGVGGGCPSGSRTPWSAPGMPSVQGCPGLQESLPISPRLGGLGPDPEEERLLWCCLVGAAEPRALWVHSCVITAPQRVDICPRTCTACTGHPEADRGFAAKRIRSLVSVAGGEGSCLLACALLPLPVRVHLLRP